MFHVINLRGFRWLWIWMAGSLDGIKVFKRPGVAGAVLQIPTNWLIHWFSQQSFSFKFSKHHESQPLGLATWYFYTVFTTCHMSCLTSHPSGHTLSSSEHTQTNMLLRPFSVQVVEYGYWWGFSCYTVLLLLFQWFVQLHQSINKQNTVYLLVFTST